MKLHLLTAMPFEDGHHTKPLAVIYRKLMPAMIRFIKALKQAVLQRLKSQHKKDGRPLRAARRAKNRKAYNDLSLKSPFLSSSRRAFNRVDHQSMASL